MKKNKIQNLTLIALMSAILCIMGPIVIPIGMVPMSFTNMAIYLTIILLDKKRATISVAIYLLIGFVGMPVFSGFIMERLEKSKILALCLGTICLYLVGTIWLMLQSKLGFATAISVGVLPFLIFDIIKILVAIALGNSIKKRIRWMV